MAATNAAADAPQVAAAVRDAAMRGEPDRYLAATLAPWDLQAPLAAIAAFASELARIPASVSEPMLGEIRLQWWRDALAAGRAGSQTGHPVADALSAAERVHGLPVALLEGMIDGRELDLSGGLAEDDAGLFAYLDRIEGHAFDLALQVLGVPGNASGPLAAAAARSYGLARALGRLDALHHNGGLPLTAARLRRHGAEPESLAAVPPSQAALAAAGRAAEELRQVARRNLDAIRQEAQALPRRQRVGLLPLAMVEPYLRAQSGLQGLEPGQVVSPLVRVARIGLAHVRARF